jgi:surface polysaccharide O-acyltransferase-like enzyme
MEYFSRAAFPVYILHQTYIIAAGYFVLEWKTSPSIQFILIAASAFALSILSYEGIRRVKFLKILFGVK